MVSERRACFWGRGNVCRRQRQGHSVSDVIMVIPESLDRRAEGSNCVGKGYAPGAPNVNSDCFLDSLGENEEVYGVSKALPKAPFGASQEKTMSECRVLALENHASRAGVNAPGLPCYNKARMFHSRLRQAAWERTAHHPMNQTPH